MIFLITAIGAGTGAALGYFGKCTSGACPLTANPWRGAFVGGALAALFAVSSAHARLQDEEEDTNDIVPHVKGQEQFKQDVLNSKNPVLVDFYANWCGPCRSIAPTIALIHQQYAPERLKVVKVNVDNNKDVARQYGVRGIPHLLVFKNGQIIASQTGAMPRNKLIEWVDKAIQD